MGSPSREGPARLCRLFPQVAYFQSALDKLNEAIKLAKVKLRKAWLPLRALSAGSKPGLWVCWHCLYLMLSPPFPALQGQPDTVQDALRFAMDVIGGK